MIYIIDNYDSFTYNLYQYIGMYHKNICVVRNDEITVAELAKREPKGLIFSPGPGHPKNAGYMIDMIRYFSGKVPILGICLGHQGIGEAFGGTVIHSDHPMHGKQSQINIEVSEPLFNGIGRTLMVGRYHSLVVQRESLPRCLEVIGEDLEGQIMALKHRVHETYGLQFHPESILTEEGQKMIGNFIEEIIYKKRTAVFLEENLKEKKILQSFIQKVVDKQDLSEEEAREAMGYIMDDQATSAQIAAFLTALRMKGETVEEITGFVKTMRSKANRVYANEPIIDIVGTGGDMANTFNISTTAAFVVAGAGMKVAKHGNRSVSSKSGAADVLEALGIHIGLSPEQAAKCLEQCGISFLFAPVFHNSMRFAAVPRRETGIRTVFNILGPLANPAEADYILLGVYDEGLMEVMAQVLMKLGIKGAMIVHGDDGLDEVSISTATKIYEVRDNMIHRYKIHPNDFGLETADKHEIMGGNALKNSQILMNLLTGKATTAQENMVLLNAGCALYISNHATTIQEGIEMAKLAIKDASALGKLNELIMYTNDLEGVS